MQLVELPGDHSEAERAQLADGEEDVYELADLVLPPGRSKDRRFALRDDDGRLVASAGILTARVAVEQRAFPVVGIGGVIVTRSRRGQGLFRRVMEPALAAARREGPDFALLFCLRKNAFLYEKLGFATLPHPVTSTGIVIPLDTMWLALRPGAQWPPGPVTLLGPMF
ncbi:GNAT family N-acetyltransferase [Solirubrobacter sp. CPCC 204708]|uniref:GNAT family N-acetyltransferase n=1 Tax=Solirubrobacter deserti TaxID=2282478 RepID=A0ABT4RFS9_9ACTN|nr:GNAT family N-acetyltransferase [Solirubrobacter deserti]MBE2318099.1 GNAT family N-acetyltransferase [Solirubrobacter deserti]MDA0137377.1 GNAT family N-acetyltransferase [Solirubrobacter deserti]